MTTKWCQFWHIKRQNSHYYYLRWSNGSTYSTIMWLLQVFPPQLNRILRDLNPWGTSSGSRCQALHNMMCQGMTWQQQYNMFLTRRNVLYVQIVIGALYSSAKSGTGCQDLVRAQNYNFHCGHHPVMTCHFCLCSNGYRPNDQFGVFTAHTAASTVFED